MPSEFDELDAILAAPSAATAAAPVQTPAPAPVRQAEPSEFAELDAILNEPVKPKPEPSGIFRRTVGDIGVGLARGVPQWTQAVIGAVDLAHTPGLLAGQMARNAVKGQPLMTPDAFSPGIVGRTIGKVADFKATDAAIGDLLSPEAKEAQRRVSESQGLIGKIKTSLENPSSIVQGVAQSAATMLGGGAIGKAVGMAQPALVAAKSVLPAAIGESGAQAGSLIEQARQETPGGVITPKTAGLALASGVTTGGLGYLGGRLAKSLGFADFDTGITVGFGDVVKRNKALQVLGGMIEEGLFEEAGQSATEQMYQNVATGRPMMEGVPDAVAQGLLTGAAMGGGANLIAGRANATPTTTVAGQPAPAVESEAALDPETEALIVRLQEEQAQAAARPATPLPPAPGIGGYIAPEGAPVTPEAELDAVLQGAGADIRADNRAQDAAARVEQEQGAISDIDAIKAKVAADKQALRQRVAELVAQRQAQTPSSGLQDNAIKGEVPAPPVQPASLMQEPPVEAAKPPLQASPAPEGVQVPPVASEAPVAPAVAPVDGVKAAGEIIPNSRDLKITNVDQLPRGTGARYLEVIRGENGVLVAKQWRRKPVKGVTLVDFDAGKQVTAQVNTQDEPGLVVANLADQTDEQIADMLTGTAMVDGWGIPDKNPRKALLEAEASEYLRSGTIGPELQKEIAAQRKTWRMKPADKKQMTRAEYDAEMARFNAERKASNDKPKAEILAIDREYAKKNFAQKLPVDADRIDNAKIKVPEGYRLVGIRYVHDSDVANRGVPVAAPAPTFTGKVGYRMAPIDIKRAGYVQLKEAAKGNTWSDGATVWDSAKVKSTTGLRAELMRHRAAYMPEEDQAAIRKAMTEAHQKRSAATRNRTGTMSDKTAMERYAAQEMVAVQNGKDAPIDEQDMSDGGYVRIGERWFRVSVPEEGRGKTLTAANGEKIELDLGEATDGKVAIPANSPNHAAIDAEFKAEFAATPQVPAPKIENDPFEAEREAAPQLTLESQTPEQVKAERTQAEAKAAQEALANKPPSKPLDTTGDMFDQSKAENPLFATPTPRVAKTPPTQADEREAAIAAPTPNAASLLRQRGESFKDWRARMPINKTVVDNILYKVRHQLVVEEKRDSEKGAGISDELYKSITQDAEDITALIANDYLSQKNAGALWLNRMMRNSQWLSDKQEEAWKVRRSVDGVKPLFSTGTPSTGIPRSTYDTAVASESRVLPMGEKAQAFDRLEDAPTDVQSAVLQGTARVLGKDTQGQVRAVTLGDRSYFFLDRYANDGEIRQDIREEFFHRIENEYAGYGKASTLGTLTYGGKWSGIKNEITRNYGLRPGQEGFFRELAAKAYRDGLTDRTVWGKFLDAVVATVKATARRMGVKLDLSDAEIRDHVNGVLRAKVEATPTDAMEPRAQFARGEAPVTPSNITRINKDTITAEREAKGYGPQPERVPVSDEALMQQANDAIAADKSLMDRTVDDFQKEMRAPQPNELGILVRAKQDRRVELDKANADIDAAEKANDPAALKAARDRWAYADKRDREITQIFSVGGVGSQAGLLLQKFKIAIDDDFSVVHLQRSVESKQGWKPLNAKQKASLADIAKQYQNGERIVQERMAEHEAEVSKLRESRDIADELLTLADQELQDARLNEAFLRDVLDKMPEPDMSVPVSKTIQNDAKSAGQAARERMKARQSSVIDAEMLKDAFDVGYEFFIEEAVNLKASAKPKAGQQALFARGEAQDGVNPAWAEKMVAIYGEQIRPRLQEIQDAARKRFGYQQGLEAAKVRKPATPRQPAPRKPGNVLDRSEITEMFKDQAKAGVRDGKVALENVSRIVQEVYPDVSSEQVRDIFTGKDKEKGREPDLIVKATGDMRRQLQTITNIELLGKLLHPILFGPKRTKPSATARELMRRFMKMFKQSVADGTLELDQDALDARRASALDAAKTRINNRIEELQKSLETGKPITVNNTPLEYDTEIKNLIALRDELQAAYDKRFKSDPLTYEQQVEQAIKATDRAIAAQQQKVDDIKAGNRKDTSTGRKSLWSAELGERKLTLQALRDAYDELELAAFPPPTALQKAIDTKRKRYETATKEFNRRLREKDFAKRQVPHVDISGDKAALDALEQMGIAKARFLHEKRRAAWQEMSLMGKAGSLVGAVWDTSRDVLSSGELSAIGRQGYPGFFINPHAWVKANRAMFRSLSRESSKAVIQEFKQRKNYTNGFYKRGGLPISEDDGRGNFDKTDDRIRANIVNHIPILGASNRAYAAFLNNLRAELFDWLLAQHDSAANPSDALLREIGDTVGILTGKGRLGGSSEVLQRVVYAPSFFKSSFDIITGKPVLGTSDKQLKWMMAKAYGKLLAGTGMIALLATIMGGGDGDDEIEWNMTSADFGMMKVGHYKVGIFGFVRPLLTYLARHMTGYMKTDKGKVRLYDTLPAWTNPQGIAPKVRQGQDIDQVNWRFIKSKLHPAISGVSAASTGRDFGGSPISREKAIMEMFTPITWKDLSEASKIETLDMMVLLTILMAAGFDVRMDYNDPVVKRYLDSKKKL